MSQYIGLLMVWLGGALCGTVCTLIWFARYAIAMEARQGGDGNRLHAKHDSAAIAQRKSVENSGK